MSSTIAPVSCPQTPDFQPRVLMLALSTFSGLLFTCRALQNSRVNESEDLQTSFRKAYDVVLKHHHGFAIRTIVSVSTRVSPMHSVHVLEC
jgi:hypothetical protein